jgi:hypothetical protein
VNPSFYLGASWCRTEGGGQPQSRSIMGEEEKKVLCYMDVKIGPRFAGRMVFEVGAPERATGNRSMAPHPRHVMQPPNGIPVDRSSGPDSHCRIRSYSRTSRRGRRRTSVRSALASGAWIHNIPSSRDWGAGCAHVSSKGLTPAKPWS